MALCSTIGYAGSLENPLLDKENTAVGGPARLSLDELVVGREIQRWLLGQDSNLRQVG
jgi:hypothetical protein